MSSQAVAWAIVMQAGGPSAKAVLMSIANYANAYGECWQDQKTLAEGAELQVRQFRNILRSLVERGLVEQVRRGGQGRGRLSDVLRLRMRELPAILTAKRREEGQEIDADEQPATGQIDRKQPAISSNRQRLPLAQQPAKIAERATGNLEGGNRQMVAATVESHIPTYSKKSKGAKKGEAGFQIPADWEPSPELLTFAATHGYTEHEARFMAHKMVLHFEGGVRRPGWDRTYQKWVTGEKPWQVKAAAANWRPLDFTEALRIWRASEFKFWDRSKYGPAPNEQGYRGPEPDLLNIAGATP